ncbi:MAG: M13 family metallopeptidase [Lachnospiraceae bacterium]|nr:M13 family metallopeptidase [Lachnospiraceae bacterium]
MKMKLNVKGIVGIALSAVMLLGTPLSSLAYKPTKDEKLDLKGLKDTWDDLNTAYAVVDLNGDYTGELIEAEVSGRYLKVKIFKYKKSGIVKVKAFKKVSNMWVRRTGRGRAVSFVLSTAGKPYDTYTEYKINGTKAKKIKVFHTKKQKGKTVFLKGKKQIKKAAFKKYVRKVKNQEVVVFSRPGYPWIDSGVLGYAATVGNQGVKEDAHLALNYDYLSDDSELLESEYDIVFKTDVEELIRNQKKEIFDGGFTSDADGKRVRDYFNMVRDWSTRDTLGTEPLKKYLDRIEAISSMDELTAYLTAEDDYVMNRFVDVLVAKHPKEGDGKTYVCSIGEDPGSYGIEEKTIINALKKSGYTEKQAKKYIDDYSEIYEGMFIGKTDNISEEGGYYYKASKVDSLCKKFPLTGVLNSMGAFFDKTGVVTWDKTLFKNLDKIYVEKNLEKMKGYLISANAAEALFALDKKTTVKAYNDLLQTLGYPKISFPSDSSKWDDFTMGLCLAEYGYGDENQLSVAIENAYAKKYFTDEDKKKVTDLTREIIDNYAEMLTNEDWLSESTKTNAVEKLRAMKINVIRPETLTDTSYLDIKEGDNLLDLKIRSGNLFKKQTMKYTGSKASDVGWNWDIDAWAYTSTDNAMNDFESNSIYILGGYVNRLKLLEDDSDEAVYGCMGTVIGHEISHAFDAVGAYYDKDGNYFGEDEDDGGWWTKKDLKAFNKKCEKVASYFSGIIPLNSVSMDGYALTSEAIADMGGMAVILKMAKENPSFDYEKFFKTYAGGFNAYKSSRIGEVMRVFDDEHPLGFLRTNVTVQQFDEFYKTFDVGKGDGMYLAPKDRIKIW